MHRIKNDFFNETFNIKINELNEIENLSHKNDPVQMNWVEGEKKWGHTITPKEIQTKVERSFTEAGNLKETYTFINKAEFPVFLDTQKIGIYTTFNDNYQEASICLKKRCHTHIFCGLEASYVMALRMSGRGPHLGLILLKGSLISYSVERNLADRSNDRGDFILHPQIKVLEPGEAYVLEWELFWFEKKESFFETLLRTPDYPIVICEQCTWFLGEKIEFKVLCKNSSDSMPIISMNGQNVLFSMEKNLDLTVLHVELQAESLGENRIDIQWNKIHTYALFWICKSIHEIIEKRCYFIASKQQYLNEESHLHGAYLIFDNDKDEIYYNHLDDHNGGRERVCMGILMARWLQNHTDQFLERSLNLYIEYVYRELYDRETGTVYNDINHNLDWDRLYNYPWMSVFQIELFHLTKDISYLKDAYRTMLQYYLKDGKNFYGIGIPMTELYYELLKNEMEIEADILKKHIKEHVECVYNRGIEYPESEVAYEQSIVAPAVSCLLQGYEIFNDEKYLEEAKKQLQILSLFNGNQPDYHLYENAIRHWDGYWFGKNRCYGDTFPHYWSVLTGIEYARYEKITKNLLYHNCAIASLRGCMSLFSFDGKASCAMVFPESINERKGHYYDSWANDQDWALYYALKEEKNLVDLRRKDINL